MASKFITDVKGVLEDTFKMAEDEGKKFGKETVEQVKVVVDKGRALTAKVAANLYGKDAQDALQSIANGVGFHLEAIARNDAKEALKRLFSVSFDFASRILGVVLKVA